MKKVAFVRGAYMNPFESQSYIPDGDITYTGISSKHPIGAPAFPLIKLWCPADVANTGITLKGIRFAANRTLGDMQVLWGLELLAGKFDIFHSADPHYFYSYQLAKLRKEGKIKKLLLTSWETIPGNNEGTAAKKKIKRFSLSYGDKILTYTKKAKKALLIEGVPAKKIITIPLSIDAEVFKPAVSDTVDRKTILFVGRLVPEKGILDLYEAYKLIVPHFPEYILRIVGRGPLERSLGELIHIDRLEDRVIIENKEYSGMPDVYRESTIGVFPSVSTETWEEQYGMVILEALSTGLPIITTRSGTIPEVAGDACIYTEESDPAGLAQKIRHMLTDKSETRKIGTMGRRRTETTFNIRLFSESIKKLYNSL